MIAQLNHELDIIHDTSPEGMFTLAKQSKTSHGWFKGFPYAHPDPTLPAVIFNHQNDMFKNRDVRWALALLIDIKAVSMASYRGAATISAIGVPPTGTHPDVYHEPLEDWLKDFELDTGKRKIKPYDPTVGKQIADMLRPSHGRADPDRRRGDRQGVRPRLVEARSAGRRGAAGEGRLHQAAATTGTRRTASPSRSSSWSRAKARPVMTRAGTMIAQQWRQFGIDATTVVAQAAWSDRRAAGDFEAIISWSVETWGGHPDLSFFLDSWHSQFVAPPGKLQPPRNWQRWSQPRARQDHRADPRDRLRRSEGRSSSARSTSSWRCGRCRSSR